MKRFKTISILLVIMLLIISACSNKQTEVESANTEQKQSSEQKPEKAEKETETAGSAADSGEEAETFNEAAPPFPGSLGELLAYPIGEFHNVDSLESTDAKKKLEQFPVLSENASKEEKMEYAAHIVSLFVPEYPDPMELAQQWKASKFGSPDMEDPRYQFKEHYNVEIILDASGSMAGKIGSKTKMELAKEAIREFTASLPEQANVALRVYGHKGSNADKDKGVSCNSNELVYELQPYDVDQLNKALEKFKPTGWTPIAESLAKAQEDLSMKKGTENTNIIYLVSDGVETCDGNPVSAGKNLKQSEITPLVNIIGFDVDSEGNRQLKEVARAAGGTYASVQSQDELQKEFDRSAEMAKRWFEWLYSSKRQINIDHSERKQEIMNFHIEWKDKMLKEVENERKAILYLKSEGKLSEDQDDDIMELIDSHYEFVSKTRDNLFDDLNQMATADFEEVTKELEKTYNERMNGQ
ncbi:vWA domain-containing protein [Bacillus marinisedimentorum]|uniref:vWA domain-containing protein n=1 Tax=Bacillus marinisedimentorum TaxID=1821260 RepID=UPI000872E630|nr:VWA domain-containing protein [Bacillus marinisedimentorum]